MRFCNRSLCLLSRRFLRLTSILELISLLFGDPTVFFFDPLAAVKLNDQLSEFLAVETFLLHLLLDFVAVSRYGRLIAPVTFGVIIMPERHAQEIGGYMHLNTSRNDDEAPVRARWPPVLWVPVPARLNPYPGVDDDSEVEATVSDAQIPGPEIVNMVVWRESPYSAA